MAEGRGKNFRILAERAPGVHGVITDGISHGREIDEIQRRFGWVPVAPVTAAKLDRLTGERVAEKSGPLTTVTVDGCTADPIELWYYGGRLVKRQMVEDGTHQLVDLVWKGTLSRRNKDGTFRRYVEYEVVCNCGAHRMVHRESTITSAEDKARKLTRGENVRAIPPGTEPFDAIYPFRSPIEGEYGRIDDHLPLGRTRSYGAKRILLDLVGHGHQVNSYGRFPYGPGGERRHEAPDLVQRDAA